MALPHFLIIGAMKSATTTLYDQLRQQPGIFLPDLKEPNFFSDDEQYARGTDWYRGLFANACPGDLVGEASTHYAKLPTYPATTIRMARLLHEPRLVYVMRHPIERLISQYIHQWSEGEIDCGLEEAVERHPELVDYSRYAFQLAPYFGTYGEQAVLPVFFESLMTDPRAELERVCQFIGYHTQPHWNFELAPRNLSNERVRKFPLYGELIELTLATVLRRALVPKWVRTSIRQQLIMRDRPMMSAATRTRLEQLFDRDLSALKGWLGRSVSCGSFGQAVSRQ